MSSGDFSAINEGVSLYDQATGQGFWQRLSRHLRGKSVQLLSYDEIRARLRLSEGAYVGLQNIPLDRIVGSVGRYREFTSTFLPTSLVDRERWSRVYAQIVGEKGLPPIEVYRVGDSLSSIYFVRDGNHRVSVARALKFKTIEAYVTDITTAICLDQILNRELDEAEAYARFLYESELTLRHPRHEYLCLSEPTRYNDLLGHIHLHTQVTGESAADWHDRVYVPTIELIRQYDMLRYFPGRTEADLYLWLVDHLCELELCYQGDNDDLNPALVDFLRQRRLPIPAELQG